MAEEVADARALYRVLAEVGGTQLVGSARELDAGTFYQPRERVMAIRLVSLALLIAAWYVGAQLAGAAACCPTRRRSR